MRSFVRRVGLVVACVGLASCGGGTAEDAVTSDCDLGSKACSSLRALGRGYFEGFLPGTDRPIVVFPNDTNDEWLVQVWSNDGSEKISAFSTIPGRVAAPAVGLAGFLPEGGVAELRWWDPATKQVSVVSDDLICSDHGFPQFGVCGSKVWYWAAAEGNRADCGTIRLADLSDPTGTSRDLGYGCYNTPERFATFSSDCRQLVFPTDFYDLGHHDLETGVTTLLRNHGASDGTYQFSEDGRTVAFTTRTWDGEGPSVDRLMVATGSPPVIREISTDFFSLGRLSPDGSAVAFTMLDGSETLFSERQLYVAPAGGEPVLLERRALGWGATFFSPDASRVAFLRAASEAGEADLVVKDLDTEQEWIVERKMSDWRDVFAEVSGDTPAKHLLAGLRRTHPQPRFSASGRSLVYFTLDGDSISLRSFSFDSGERTVHYTGNGDGLRRLDIAGEWLAFNLLGDGLLVADLAEERPARLVARGLIWMFDIRPDALAFGAAAEPFGEDVFFLPLSRD